MIRVTKIVGESFDIDSGKETPKSVVLSNGKREVVIPVGDDVAQAIVGMLVEELEGRLPRTPRPTPTLDEVLSSPDGQEALSKENYGPDWQEQVSRRPVQPELAENPEDGPGDEYDDPATGVGSL